MIHDYYLPEATNYSVIELGKKKKDILNAIKNEIDDCCPNPDDLNDLPEHSILVKITFTLKKPYTSKDEGEFHIIDNRICENPIVRDKFTGLPIVKPSTWKGHLRFAAERVEWEKDEKKIIIKRLFGSEPEEDETLKGRLYFFPTFFEDTAEIDVITPLKRDTRTPAKGAPIYFEVMKPGKEGKFYLLYVPYPKGKEFKETQIKEDLKFFAEALKLMFYTYGFSAKKTSGFGVINEELNEGKLWLSTNKYGEFSNLKELPQTLESLWS